MEKIPEEKNILVEEKIEKTESQNNEIKGIINFKFFIKIQRICIKVQEELITNISQMIKEMVTNIIYQKMIMVNLLKILINNFN